MFLFAFRCRHSEQRDGEKMSVTDLCYGQKYVDTPEQEEEEEESRAERERDDKLNQQRGV